MKHNKTVKAYGVMSAAYEATSIKAAKDMPAEGTLNQLSKYVYDQLKVAHKEIAWGVELIKYTPGKWSDTTSM